MFDRLFVKIPSSKILKKLRYVFWPGWQVFLKGWRNLVRASVKVQSGLLPVRKGYAPCPTGYYETTPKDVRFHEIGSGAFVAELPHGRVWGPMGTVVTAENIALMDLSRDGEYRRKEHPVFLRHAYKKTESLTGKTAVLAVCSGHWYFHWVTQVLPRVHFLELSGIRRDSVQHWIVNEMVYPYESVTLELLGIQKNKCVVGRPSAYLEAESLLAPSLPGDDRRSYDLILPFLRNSFLPHKKESPLHRPKRIYLSRTDASHRFLQNEKEVLKLLRQYDFVPVTLSALPFLEQVDLFYHAEAVLGVHGAGLTNIAFCQPGAKVIELFSPKYVYDCYRAMALSAGLHYAALWGTGTPGRWANTHRTFCEDLTLEISKLQEVLTYL